MKRESRRITSWKIKKSPQLSERHFLYVIFSRPGPGRCEQKMCYNVENCWENNKKCFLVWVRIFIKYFVRVSVFILLFFHYKRAGRRLSRLQRHLLHVFSKGFNSTSTYFTPPGYIYILLSTIQNTTTILLSNDKKKNKKEFCFFMMNYNTLTLVFIFFLSCFLPLFPHFFLLFLDI